MNGKIKDIFLTRNLVIDFKRIDDDLSLFIWAVDRMFDRGTGYIFDQHAPLMKAITLFWDFHKDHTMRGKSVENSVISLIRKPRSYDKYELARKRLPDIKLIAKKAQICDNFREFLIDAYLGFEIFEQEWKYK